MSFITKRERVFNDYDVKELPNRNEGKLKAYSSCTDARAWSHFGSDKTEHLVDIIKKNNCVCRPKYIPTETIIDTLMVSKNAKITALQRRIEEFEEMMTAYDELDLTCEQKCEIAKAHATIKEANKDLHGLFLNLDMDVSQFTEGSEGFETGKSRGDEGDQHVEDPTPKSKGNDERGKRVLDEKTNDNMQEKEKERTCQKPCKEVVMVDQSNQVVVSSVQSAGTMVTDPRIQEMHDTIVAKDAKMAAMTNTMSVMENDVCEPYCIYAHIYTALVKIFTVLCQNDKYKLYLNLMTSGKDMRCIDIKGKILFKLKVLEKFSLALISPCAQESRPSDNCTCYRAEFKSRVEATFALTSAESTRPRLDSQRAQLVADIMENDEMREILSKENSFTKTNLDIDEYEIEEYNIEKENLKRLKNLQENYDDLMACYESVKHEKDCLQNRCLKYDELQKEFEALKDQLREYSMLWNEKEHYRRRSADLDSLKEQYLVLSEETSNIELQLKAESEINNIKSKTIEELRQDNLYLEQKVNEASIVFEKEKNALNCKLKEVECKTMCQDQQIRSLSIQVDNLLEQGPEKEHREGDTMELQDEINKLNEQITNLKAVCICNDEGKQQMQEEFQTNLINSLKMEIEELKSGCEEILQRNDFLEKNAETYKNEINKLDQNVKEKSKALENLMDVLQRKSNEVNRLMNDMEQRNKENGELYSQVQNLQETYDRSLTSLETDKMQAIKQLNIANKESQELLKMVNSYDNMALKQDELESSFQAKISDYHNLKTLLTESQTENIKLQKDLQSRESNNSLLLQELNKIREVSRITEKETNKYKHSVELTKNESKMLKEKLEMFGNLSEEFERLKNSHERLEREKKQLETMLQNKSAELNDALYSIEINKQESEELLDKLHSSENLKLELSKLNDDYGRILIEKKTLQNEVDNLLKSFNKQSLEAEALNRELLEMKATYNKLLSEKNILQADFDNQADQYNNLYNSLENKIDENKDLMRRLSNFENLHEAATSNIASLIEENYSTKNNLTALRKESDELLEKVKYYELLEAEYNKLKNEHDQICFEKNKLQRELDHRVCDIQKIERDNRDLSRQSNELLSHSEILEKALINARTELIEKSNYPDSSHAEIIKEIEEMKKEKLNQHKRISELLDKLDESENEFARLYEVIGARDDKIAVLQNHINALQDEVQKLQKNLEAVVETGEQISDHSSQKLNESLLSIDAHHSRATHNMKMELAKLQSTNSMHEESEAAMKREKQKYSHRMNELLHEREIIVTDIKQLEIRSVGDSALSPDKCKVEDVLISLERIGKVLDVKCSKSNSLEQTLLTVQNSYQLVQTKTDEAKKIVEKEKQKIISEKEEAIKDKLNMEKQLHNLKEKLKQQKIRDENIIKDLEAEILNQKLITDKVTQSTQSFIAKLEDDLKSLQALYENSLQTIGDLENKLKSERSHNLSITQKIGKDLENKIQEVEHLNKVLSEVKKGPGENVGIQTMTTPSHNVENQTNDGIDINVSDKTFLKDKYESSSDKIEIHPLPLHKKRDKASPTNDNNKEVFNEVRVLTASIEPSFDFVRSSYLDYKLKRLKQGEIDICSISSHSDININTRNQDSSTNKDDNLSPRDQRPKSSNKTDSKSQGLKVIDLYNKKSVHTYSSSKGNELDNEFTENDKETDNIKSTSKSGAYTLSNRSNHHSFATISKTKNKYKNNERYASTSESTDRDLFVIYKDSESGPDNTYENKRNWNGKSEIVVEAVTIQNNKDKKEIKQHLTNNKLGRKHESDNFYGEEEEEYEEDDSVKHKLKISLPRVGTDSQSNEVSDLDKKSLDSYSMAIDSPHKTYSSSNDYKDGSHGITYTGNNRTNSSHSISREERYSNTISVKRGTMAIMGYKKDVNQNERNRSSNQNRYREPLTGSDFHHKLSRVEADVLLLKPEEDTMSALLSNTSKEQDSQNYGLNYILDSHKYPDNIKTYIAAKGLRKTRSDDRVTAFSTPERSKDASPSRSELKKLSLNNKTISICSKPSPKSYTERSIMVSLGTAEEYENKIRALTRTLETIEKDYKKRIDAIKTQYDSNIKSILNEHNQGVESIQNLHEETLQDILKIHENEVENLRTMSIEAMRKAEKLEKENKSLKNKFADSCSCLHEEPTKITTPELKRKRRRGVESRTLTKTNIEAFNVKPTNKLNGPCTCTLDLNISDTIRNIFEQVDVEQRKLAEQSYLKYIANKIMSGSVDVLDTQELSFLHLKVCRIWKTKIFKEETLQKRIDSLEAELLCKQKNTQQNIAELDRKVAEERKRLQEVREAVCRSSLTAEHGYPAAVPSAAERDFILIRLRKVGKSFMGNCVRFYNKLPSEATELPIGKFKQYIKRNLIKKAFYSIDDYLNDVNAWSDVAQFRADKYGCSTCLEPSEHLSDVDLVDQIPSGLRQKRTRNEINRAVSAKLDAEDRREKKMYTDEMPTRLRKSHDRDRSNRLKK